MIERKFPLVFEINARVWLRELTAKTGERVTLANVPEAEFQKWKQRRFDMIWLMGVWKPSAKGREIALNHKGLWEDYNRALPDWSPSDVGASPYSIPAYVVSDELGGESGLQKFRERLRAIGIRLILDFVPNHVALDHHWTSEHPEYFISAPKHVAMQSDGFFALDDERYVACGKDPYFPAWTDTLQLNYANPDLQKAMIETLLSIAKRCDGARCDMAMLVLQSVFNQTWRGMAEEMKNEFWSGAISLVKSINPEFLFIAEAYWQTEWTLQMLGFDFTYDKTLYDRLHRKDISGVKAHLSASWDYQRKMVCFTENHDEPRAALHFGKNNRAALLLALTMPSMRLVHQGQLEGFTRRLPVQLLRRFEEATDEGIGKFYQRLAQVLDNPAIGSGNFQQLSFHGSGSERVIGFTRYYGSMLAQTFTLVNLTDESAEVHFHTDAFKNAESYEHLEIITTEPKHSPQFDLWNGGISVRLRANEGLLFIVNG